MLRTTNLVTRVSPNVISPNGISSNANSPNGVSRNKWNGIRRYDIRRIVRKPKKLTVSSTNNVYPCQKTWWWTWFDRTVRTSFFSQDSSMPWSWRGGENQHHCGCREVVLFQCAEDCSRHGTNLQSGTPSGPTSSFSSNLPRPLTNATQSASYMERLPGLLFAFCQTLSSTVIFVNSYAFLTFFQLKAILVIIKATIIMA